MSLFGSKKAGPSEARPTTHPAIDQRAETEESRRRRLKELAVEAEKDVLAKRDAYRSAFAAELDLDRAAYRFECRRWGDFLTIQIERRTRQWPDGYSSTRFATSVNLQATRTIRLLAGRGPDDDGYVEYRTHHRSTKEGVSEIVLAEMPPKEPQHTTFKLDGGDNYNHGYRSDRMGHHITRGFPRPAEDDAIRFEGVGATIFTPAGRGQQVLDAILSEIAASPDQPERASVLSPNG